MTRTEAIELILLTVRTIKSKSFSELTTLQQQAACFCGDYFPAERDITGKPVYARNGTVSTLAPSYKWFNQQKGALTTMTGLGANTFQIILDEGTPPMIETTWTEAIDAFPSWKVPRKLGKYDHLPYLKNETTTLQGSVRKIAAALAETAVCIIREIPMPTNLDAIHKMVHIYPEQARKIGTALGQEAAVRLLLNYQPKKNTVGSALVEGEEIDVKRFKLPRGTVDATDYEGSYLSVYITFAYQGKYLKADTGM